MAARAAHLVQKRAASEKNAGDLGYADGFLTAQTMAAQLTLSRVGFTEQYLSDTIKYYTKNKVLSSHTKKSYRKKFNSGLKKLEKELVKKVEEMVN